MTLSLNGTWRLYYHLEDGPLPETPAEAERAGWPCVPATVPGNVELDLVAAGVEEDPFFGENIYRFRKYEFFQWWFVREFERPESEPGARWALCFDGLNDIADVYLNDARVGHAENALIEHSFDVTDALRPGVNRLAVRIRSALNWAREQDYPASVASDEYSRLRMPPSSFGWDIMGRFLSAGMWRGVRLESLAPTRILDAYYATPRPAAHGAMALRVKYRFTTNAPILDGFRVRVRGRCGDSRFEAEAVAPFVSGEMHLTVPDAKLWWPKGYGPANLYDVELALIRDGAVVDVRRDRIGLRHIRLEHRLAPRDEGEFKVVVNGVDILVKGTNWVPLDALHSRDAERLRAAHDLLDEVGCNAVRCWGGNVYEDHAFFDLCDERGILVWQDFAMACAIYPYDQAFRRALEEEAVSVVRKLRNHPCILLWAGDNEVDEGLYARGFATDENCYNPLTREVLPAVIRANDPYRMFLPSSPCIPAGMPEYDAPEQHNWGARAYFKDDFYKHSSAHFISECGYHGCPALSSMRRYIPEKAMERWFDADVWDTHNTDYVPFGRRGYNRNGLMKDQVRVLTGGLPGDLKTFMVLSQISQAEAKKFFVERTRLKKWRRTGVMWWNLLDGWPQISDAVVDYYYAKKIAFHYLKRIQRPVCLMMDEQEGWEHRVVLGNDGCWSGRVTWQVLDGETGETLCSGACDSVANENNEVARLRACAGEQRLYLLRWQIDGAEYANHYISGYPPYNPEKLLGWLEIIRKLPEPFEVTF